MTQAIRSLVRQSQHFTTWRRLTKPPPQRPGSSSRWATKIPHTRADPRPPSRCTHGLNRLAHVERRLHLHRASTHAYPTACARKCEETQARAPNNHATPLSHTPNQTSKAANPELCALFQRPASSWQSIRLAYRSPPDRQTWLLSLQQCIHCPPPEAPRSCAGCSCPSCLQR